MSKIASAFDTSDKTFVRDVVKTGKSYTGNEEVKVKSVLDKFLEIIKSDGRDESIVEFDIKACKVLSLISAKPFGSEEVIFNGIGTFSLKLKLGKEASLISILLGKDFDNTIELGSSFVSEIPVGNLPTKLNEGILFVSENEDGREDDNTKSLGGVDRDAFGADLRTMYDCMEPHGVFQTLDYGAGESHVGA